MTLEQKAADIVFSGRAAGHPQPTVLMALQYAREADVNQAAARLRKLKEKGTPPRWLVERWAQDASLIDSAP